MNEWKIISINQSKFLNFSSRPIQKEHSLKGPRIYLMVLVIDQNPHVFKVNSAQGTHFLDANMQPQCGYYWEFCTWKHLGPHGNTTFSLIISHNSSMILTIKVTFNFNHTYTALKGALYPYKACGHTETCTQALLNTDIVRWSQLFREAFQQKSKGEPGICLEIGV